MGVGQFLSDLYDAALGTFAGSRASETHIGSATERVEALLRTLDSWTPENVARVLSVADPLTLLGREDAALLYWDVSRTIVDRAAARGDCSARALRQGFEAGIDRLPADVTVFIKRGALREIPAFLERLASRVDGA